MDVWDALDHPVLITVVGDTKKARIANLEALHAEGRITAEKLKAAIASEG